MISISCFVETLRSCELNDEYSKFKSYSLDPFPDCQMKKRSTDSYRKRQEETDPVKVDCNGGILCTQSQRSDHIPLLVNTNRKRWHSLETMRADDREVSGCEDIVNNSKKSLGRNIIKSWIVGIFQSSNGPKSSVRNGSGILLQQQPPPNMTTPDKETSIV